jgi:hypothetical protein
VRVQYVSQYGEASGWQGTRSFTVSHPPKGINLSPSDGQVLVYDPAGSDFTWTFSDAYSADAQTAYQVDVYKASDATLVFTSGKIPSAANRVTHVIPSTSIDSDLNWYLTVWDKDDIAAPAVFGGTVYLTQLPAPTITYPVLDLDAVNTGIPTLAWTPGISGAKTQAAWRIILRNSSNQIIKDTGKVFGTEESYTVPAGLLKNNQRYSFDLTVTDSVGLDATRSRSLTTSWVPPAAIPQPFVYLDFYDSQGFASVVATVGALDPDYLRMNLYRRTFELDADWVLIHETAETPEVFVYRDYYLPAGVTSEYLLTQVVDRFGDEVEGIVASTNRVQIKPINSHYWVIDRTSPDMSIRISSVNSDSFSREIEETSYAVVDGGRQFEIGEDLGVIGSLGCSVRDTDLGWGFTENYNLVANGNLEQDAVGSVSYWTHSTPTANTIGELEAVNTPPGPTIRRNNERLYLRTQRTTGTAAFSTQLAQEILKSPYAKFEASSPYHFSAWVLPLTNTAGTRFTLKIDWLNGASVTKTDTQIMTFDTLTGYLQTRIVNGQIWYRVGMVSTAPSSGSWDRARITISVGSNSTSGNNVWVGAYTEGVQCTLGSQMVEYFDGYKIGASWVGVENKDPSFMPGSLTARNQALAMEKLKSAGHAVSLRTPFGSIWSVHVSNVNLDRVAGVGSAEFVDMEIPYAQIRDI